MKLLNNRHFALIRLLRFRYLFLVNGVVIVVLGFVLVRAYVHDREIQKDIAALQVQAEEIEARNGKIVELSGLMQTESYMEREARLKLGLKKPGEEVVVIERAPVGTQMGQVLSAEDPLGALADKTNHPESYSNSQKWYWYFFDRERFIVVSAYAK